MESSPHVYALDKLMAQTRILASEYYRTTQKTLPVSAELAHYDAIRLLRLEKPSAPLRGVDALFQNKKIQIKSRVVFKEERSGYRLGQIQAEGLWDTLVLVLFTPEYEPDEIYAADREALFKSLGEKISQKQSRGIMSIARFKAIANLIWTKESGFLGFPS